MVFLENQGMVLSSQMDNAFIHVVSHAIILAFTNTYFGHWMY